jgi:iron complex outermembrane recepter protein
MTTITGRRGDRRPGHRDRQFTGGSAAVGLHLGVAPGTALVTTVTRSYRAPALEELYNLGAHVGNLAFEIGNPDLDREATVGLDVSLRHRAPHVRGEFNTFLYRIDNFVFPDVHPDDLLDGLRLTEFRQGNSRSRASTRAAVSGPTSTSGSMRASATSTHG